MKATVFHFGIILAIHLLKAAVSHGGKTIPMKGEVLSRGSPGNCSADYGEFVCVIVNGLEGVIIDLAANHSLTGY